MPAPFLRLIDLVQWQPGRLVGPSATMFNPVITQAEWVAVRQTDRLILKAGLSAAIEPNRYKK